MSQEGVQLLIKIEQHLRSIDAGIATLVARKRASEPKEVASDRDLDGKYGDPLLKVKPRDWDGPDFRNRRFSECPPALLDLVANTYDWFAEEAEKKNERTNKGKPVADYKRADAARARGWAARIRSGRHVQTTDTTSSSGWADAESTSDDTTSEEATGWGDGF